MRAEDVFSEFYAVVLEHSGRGPLRWLPSHKGWVRYEGDRWADEPAVGDGVDEHQRDAALETIDRFFNRRGCRGCGDARDAALHYVAVNAAGAPEVYCLQWPAFDVVDSAGGTGTLKHWGSPFGCDDRGGPALQRADVSGLGRDVVAGFAYGTPLRPREVMERAWCSRCRKAALDMVEGRADSDAFEANLGRHREGLRRLARLIGQAAS